MDANSVTLIALAVVLLASLFVAYLSSKTWHVGHVILVYLVFLSTLVFLTFATKVLSVQEKYRSKAAELELKVQGLQEQNRAMEDGTDEMPGTKSLRGSLHRLTLDRGPVWHQCVPDQPAGDGTTRLTIQYPLPHGIEPDTVLYAFEEGPFEDGNRYLGKFRVAAADDQTVTITPVVKFTEGQLQRLADGQSNWALYATMPVDRHDLFTSLTDEQLEATIPGESLEEYLKDGEKAAEDDDPDRIVGYTKEGTRTTDPNDPSVVIKLYSRELRDYAWLFDKLAQQRTNLQVEIRQLESDQAHLGDAIGRITKEIEQENATKGNLETDLAKFQTELDEITRHLQSLEQQLANLVTRLAQVQDKNSQLADQLTKQQRDLAAQIDGADKSL